MHADEMRNMSYDDLMEEVEDLREELYRLRFQKTVGQLDDGNLIRYAKRDIARIMTVLRERELAAALAAAGAITGVPAVDADVEDEEEDDNVE
jgi:large subunit ribosomal protein L29